MVTFVSNFFKKALLCLNNVLCCLSVVAQVPTITSFSPASANAGATLTINGTNFSTTTGNNIVQFGTIRATVNSATANSLTVTVPQSVPNQAISVTTNGSIAFSKNKFRFLNNLGNINTTSYSAPNPFQLAATSDQHRPIFADFDGDGRVEFITSSFENYCVARNTSLAPNISFDSLVIFPANLPSWHSAITGDFDSDGKPDVVLGTTNYIPNLESLVFRNTSSYGNISFSPTPINLSGTYNYAIAVADMNLDGRLDIIAAEQYGKTIGVYFNTSTGPGNISFNPISTVSVTASPWNITVDDFDGDGRPDIASSSTTYNSSVSVFRNTTAIGATTFTLSFVVNFFSAPMGNFSTIKSADLNGDNLPEVIVGSTNATIHLWQNTSSPGSPSFGNTLTFSLNTSSVGNGLDIEDFNGDGFNDIAVLGGTTLHILQNAGLTGIITTSNFLSPVVIPSGNNTAQLFGYIVDLDGDGAKDFVSNTKTNNALYVRRYNLTCPPPPIISQPNSIASCIGSSVSFSIGASGTGFMTYQWRKNGVAIAGATSSTYIINNAVLADTGNYSVVIKDSCVLSQSTSFAYSQSAALTFSNGPVIIDQPLPQQACGGATVFSADVLSNGGSTVYQWQKNGNTIIGTNTKKLTLPYTAIADTGYYRLFVSNLCGTIFSDSVKLSFTAISTPIVANLTTCNQNGSVTLTRTGSVPASHVTRWYDDASFNRLLISGSSFTVNFPVTDTFYIRNEAISGYCHSKVDTAIITLSLNTWTGAVSTNWSSASNWSCGIVPSSISNAFIPTGPVNMPVISNGSTVNVLNLTIASGASLTMVGNSRINIYDQFVNNGTFTCPNGLVSFENSTSLVRIPGGNYFDLSFNNNQNGAVLLGSIRLANKLYNNGIVIRLDTCNFTQLNYVTSAFVGSGTSAYLATNGTGKLRLLGVGSGASLGTSAFACVGNSTYNPVRITNTGTIDTFEISVINQVSNSYLGGVPQGVALTNNVVNRTWQITETNSGGSNLNLEFGWVTANETSGFNRNSCYVSNYTSFWNLATAGGSTLTGSNYFRSRSGITTLGIFGVGSNGALPVELIDFNVLKDNNNAKLLWNTVSEKNNAYFEVEQSVDGTHFTKIDRIKGKGNSSTLVRYEHIDNDAIVTAKKQGLTTLYYRLKQVDFDGKAWQSKMATLSIDDNFYQPTLQPNPYNEMVYLNMITEQKTEVQIIISDARGRTLQNYTAQFSEGQQQLKLKDTERFSAGVYFVQIINKDNRHTLKLIKQ